MLFYIFNKNTKIMEIVYKVLTQHEGTVCYSELLDAFWYWVYSAVIILVCILKYIDSD